MPKRVGIVGGGVTGLTLAYNLSQHGAVVTLFERDPELGGLAGSLCLDGHYIEKYYHFICRGDRELIQLCADLGLSIQWRATKTSFFHNGHLYPFSTPIDLLRFSPVDLLGRVRFGLNIVRSRSLEYWQPLESISAKDWLIAQIGERAYQVIWHPLLRVKFGDHYDRISASWIWHRIHRVATSRRRLWDKECFGHIVGGSQALISALRNETEKAGSTVMTRSRVERILVQGDTVSGVALQDRFYPFDAIVSTAPLPIFVKLLEDAQRSYTEELAAIDYLGIVCMILKLRRSVTDSFWLNISDPRTANNGLIEYSNLNPYEHYGGSKIVYIPEYLSSSECRFSYSDEDLLEEYTGLLRLINTQFNIDWIEEVAVFRDNYAQPICTTDFMQNVPSIQTPIKGLYVLDSTQAYPSDRAVSAMIGLAGKACALILDQGS